MNVVTDQKGTGKIPELFHLGTNLAACYNSTVSFKWVGLLKLHAPRQ